MSGESENSERTLCQDEYNIKKVKSYKKETLDVLKIKVMGNFLDDMSRDGHGPTFPGPSPRYY